MRSGWTHEQRDAYMCRPYSMSEKIMIALAVTIEEPLFERVNLGYMQSPYASRLEFIRYLLDGAMTEWERNNA